MTIIFSELFSHNLVLAELRFLTIWVPLYLQNGEKAGRQGYHGHSEPVKHDLAGVDEDIMHSNVNLSGYRDTGKSPASDDKRATAWQDRVALKI
jgi:hypothetical protein